MELKIMNRLLFGKAFTQCFCLIAGICLTHAEEYMNLDSQTLEMFRSADLEKNWNITVGAISMVEPAAPGSKETESEVIPLIDIQYKGKYFLNSYNGLGAMLFNTEENDSSLLEEFSLGVAFDYEEGRDADELGTDLNLHRIGDVDSAISFKLFSEIELGMFELSMELGKALSSGSHEGWTGELKLGAGHRISEMFYIGTGVFVRFADQKYHEAFFGVNNEQAHDTGLEEYNPGSGMECYGVEFMSRYQFDNHWGLLLLLNYEMLAGDAKDSPIVQEENQFSSIFGITYTF